MDYGATTLNQSRITCFTRSISGRENLGNRLYPDQRSGLWSFPAGGSLLEALHHELPPVRDILTTQIARNLDSDGFYPARRFVRSLSH